MPGPIHLGLGTFFETKLYISAGSSVARSYSNKRICYEYASLPAIWLELQCSRASFATEFPKSSKILPHIPASKGFSPLCRVFCGFYSQILGPCAQIIAGQDSSTKLTKY